MIMKYKIKILIFVFLFTLHYPLIYAQGQADMPAAAVSIQEGIEQRIALDLRNMDIVDTLKFLAQKGNINIIASKDVEGRVSLFLKDVTIKDALDIIVLANNLAYEMRGEILYVMTENEYKMLHGENFKDTRRVKIVKLEYARPEAVFKALDIIKSDMGKLIVDEESGTIVLMDTPEKLQIMETTLASLDQPGLTRVFSLQYARAPDVAASLSKRLDAKKTGSVSVDKRNNQLIITALPERMKEVEELIKSLDKKTKQVLLEAKILKVILSDDFDMGVDWDEVFREAHKHGLNFAGDFALPSSGVSAITDFFKFALGPDSSVSHNHSVIVKILQTFGETRNLSSPSIAVIDGEEAKIHVGTTKAYVTTTVATGGTTATTAAQVTFMDVGVQLTVTPIINDEGYVTMKIKPEISSADSELEYQIAADVTNTVPLLSKTSAETTVMVKDGTTIIIGGLRKDEKIKTVKKLPLLGDIPWLGAAFRKTDEDLEKQEIIVFITPHIITGDIDVVDKAKRPKGLRSYD